MRSTENGPMRENGTSSWLRAMTFTLSSWIAPRWSRSEIGSRRFQALPNPWARSAMARASAGERVCITETIARGAKKRNRPSRAGRPVRSLGSDRVRSGEAPQRIHQPVHAAHHRQAADLLGDPLGGLEL